MPIKIVNNPSEIKLREKWTPAEKFNSKEKIIAYEGRQIQFIQKWQRPLSPLEKVKRVFLGVLAVIFSLGFALLSKRVIALLKKDTLAIRFAIPAANRPQEKPPTPAELAHAQIELEKGIDISDEAIALIQEKFEDICNSRSSETLVSIDCNPNDQMFTLEIAPGLIFKMKRYQQHPSDAGVMKNRYQNILLAKAVVLKNNLNCLQIPHAKLFTVEVNKVRYEIIAHQKLNFNQWSDAQEQYYGFDNLDQTICQLALFICKTGFNHVTWDNIPLLYDVEKAALINLTSMDNKEDGLFGSPFREVDGLISCVSEKQGKMVEQIAKEHGINTERFQKAIEKRKAAIHQNQKLKEFYTEKNIVTGYEPITIDENLLHFPQKEEELKTLVKDLIGKINDKIAESPLDKSIKGKRKIFLDTCSHFPDYTTEHKELVESVDPMSFKTDEEYQDATYLGQAVKKLIEIGAIHKLIYRSPRGYTLQA